MQVIMRTETHQLWQDTVVESEYGCGLKRVDTHGIITRNDGQPIGVNEARSDIAPQGWNQGPGQRYKTVQVYQRVGEPPSQARIHIVEGWDV